MKKQETALFEMKVKSILEWSSLDTVTREVLKMLMAEVAALAEKISPNK